MNMQVLVVDTTTSALSLRSKTLSGFSMIPKMAVSEDKWTFAPRQTGGFRLRGPDNGSYVNLRG
jgi:hypothetical protein